MLAKMSKKMTSFFIKKNVIEESKRETYDYCFEILLSTLINLLSIVTVSIATQMYFESFLFIVSFMLLRSTAGGYHAKTHIGCFFMLMIFYSGFLLMIKFIPVDILTKISIAIAIFSLLMVFLLAPVDSPNNPLSIKDKAKLANIAL